MKYEQVLNILISDDSIGNQLVGQRKSENALTKQNKNFVFIPISTSTSIIQPNKLLTASTQMVPDTNNLLPSLNSNRH